MDIYDYQTNAVKPLILLGKLSTRLFLAMEDGLPSRPRFSSRPAIIVNLGQDSSSGDSHDPCASYGWDGQTAQGYFSNNHCICAIGVVDPEKPLATDMFVAGITQGGDGPDLLILSLR